MSFQFDQTQFTRMAQELRAVKKFSASEMLTYMGKMLVRFLMSCTPPFGPHPFQEDLSKAQEKIGKQSIAYDLNRVFVPADSKKENQIQTTSKRFWYYIRKYEREGNTAAVKTMMAKAGVTAKFEVIKNATLEIGERSINFSKRPHSIRKRYFVLNKSSIKRVIRQAQSHVGTAKAGWMKAAAMLGVKLIPAWIRSKSGRAQGNVIDQRVASAIPFIEMINSTKGAQTIDDDVVRVAMNELQRSGLQKQLEHIFNKRGQRFNSGQKQTP